MENKYQLSTGILECYPLYAIFHFNASVYDHEEAEEFVDTSLVILCTPLAMPIFTATILNKLNFNYRANREHCQKCCLIQK